MASSRPGGGGGVSRPVARGQKFMCCVRSPRNINVFVRAPGWKESGSQPGGSVTGVTEKLFMCQMFMCLRKMAAEMEKKKLRKWPKSHFGAIFPFRRPFFGHFRPGAIFHFFPITGPVSHSVDGHRARKFWVRKGPLGTSCFKNGPGGAPHTLFIRLKGSPLTPFWLKTLPVKAPLKTT